MTEKVELIGLNKAELDRLMADIGEKPFRAKQLYQWMHEKQAASFDEMTNLSKSLQEKLTESAQKVFAKMYEQTQAAQGAAGAGPDMNAGAAGAGPDMNAGASNGADDDVVDADFKEV